LPLSASLSLISDEPELHALLGKDSNSMVSSALRYVLSQDISVTIPGLRSIAQVENAVSVGENYNGLTDSEKQRFSFNLDVYCRDCGLCMPCPENLNIPATLRFHTLYSSYGLGNWAKKLYRGLEVKADKCTSCKACEAKCPYNLPVASMVKEAESDFSS
jgi:predicted aldo/keto reductase-like oxidoreductase